MNCEVELDLSQTKDCILIEHHNITGVDLMITTTKLDVPATTLFIHDMIKCLENLKQGFKKNNILEKI